MTGIIVTTPPSVELPPSNNPNNPSNLPGVTYTYALLALPQTWGALQTFPLGTISLNAADVIGSLGAAQMPALTGDVTTVSGTVATTISANTVTNAKAAQMAAKTIKGNSTAGTANATDLTGDAVEQMLLFTQTGTGAVQRAVDGKLKDKVSVTDFGAIGDGTTDNTTAIQSAINYTSPIGKALFFPAGTYLSGTLTALPQMCLVGESPVTSVIKLKNGTNNALITSGASHVINDVMLCNIGFDGNSANNTVSDTITIYGYHPVFQNINISNPAGTGLTTQCDASFARDVTGYFQNITIDSPQGHGWYFAGPNDSQFERIMIIDAGLRTDNTYYGMYMTGNGNGRFNNFHAYNRGSTSNTPANSMLMGTSGNTVTNSHFEGSHVPLSITASANIVTGCDFYAPRGAFCVDVTGIGNFISGGVGIAAFSGNLSFKGINLRSSNNIIDVLDFGCLNGAIDFTSDAGQNFVRLNGFRATGTAIVGTPAASDDVMIAIGGAAGLTLSQRPGLAWTAYTPAPTFAGGSPVFGTCTGRYQLTGKQVAIEVVIPVTTTGTGAMTVPLPFTAQSAGGLTGGERGVSGKAVQGTIAPGSASAIVVNYDNTAPGANGAQFILWGTYERQ